jgi:phage/plasmid-associated DNA primase
MPPRGDGVRFWVYNLMGKRLVYFPDCDDDDFPASQLFKMCSGGDTVPAEAKGKQQFNVELNCKFLFSSNNKPNISGQKSDMRRAVFCEMEPIPKEPDPQYENDLWKEAENVIGACMFEYLVACEKHGPIPCEADGLEKVVSENWEFFDKIFNKHFELDNRTEIPENKRHRFSGDELSNVFDNNKLYRPKTQREFRKYLRARHGIKKTRISIQDPSGKWLRKNYYTGAWVRDDFCQDRTDPYADRG